jgi:hypothetical protein
LGERAYAHRGNDLWTVLYFGNTASVTLDNGKVKLSQQTKYPWDGEVRITVEPDRATDLALHLRIPGWCRSKPDISVNGAVLQEPKVDRGYVRIQRTWKAGDVVVLHLPMPVERVYADPRVKADVGRVALQRGPVVYCLEGVDNAGSVRNLVPPREAPLTASFVKDLLGGVVVVRGEARAVSVKEDENELTSKPVPFQAVPYFAWDNRAPGPMVVWLPEQMRLAETSSGVSTVSKGVRVCASHVWPKDSLAAVNDGLLPKASDDHDIPHMTWWDHRGTTEWVSYRYAKPRQFSGAEVYWFDDTGRGSCRVPASWRLLWLDGKEWKEVKLAEGSSYGTLRNVFNKVAFEPVAARELRLEVKLQPGVSGGILEWRVRGE